MYSKIVLGVEANDFDAALQTGQGPLRATNDLRWMSMLFSRSSTYISQSRRRHRRGIPQDPSEQFLKAIDAVSPVGRVREPLPTVSGGHPAELGTA